MYEYYAIIVHACGDGARELQALCKDGWEPVQMIPNRPTNTQYTGSYWLCKLRRIKKDDIAR